MKELLKANRAPAIVLGILALIVAAGGGALAASGGGGKTITVCVKAQGGALYQAKKCKKHDKKLTWNKQGPQGQQGQQGSAGSNGANGAVQGYSATASSSLDITKKTSYTTVVSKQLPAGSYIVSGQATLQALDLESPGQASDDTCRLIDGSAESLPVTWISPLGGIFLFRVASGTAAMQMALTTSGTSTVTLQCKNNLNAPPSEWSNTVLNASITAIQTTSNS